MAKLVMLRDGETDIDSTDIWRFSVHSDYPSQKVFSQGSFSITIPSGSDSGSYTITHSLGFKPTCRVTMIEPENGRLIRITGGKGFTDTTLDPLAYGYATYGTDNSDLIITVGYYFPNPITSSRTFQFYYIILNDSY